MRPCEKIYQGKRGISTILGVIIFVGLLFSTVIPMYLVMRQADTIYDKKMFEMNRLDDERSREKLWVCAYPTSLTSSEIKLKIKNRGDLQVKIIRVWINDEYQTQDVVIQSMTEKDIGPFPVSLQSGSYYAVKVTTERGNVFTSQASLYYYDIWYTPELSISVTILNTQGQYRIKVANETWDSGWWDSKGIIHDDFIQTFNVDIADVYTVTMERKLSGMWKELSASPAIVEIIWPDGPPLAFIYADGNKIK